MAENALAISQGLYKHIAFDPVRQLDPVCLVGNAPLVLVTSTRLKSNTLRSSSRSRRPPRRG